MAIELTCDCGKGYRLNDDKVGKRFKCRDCGTLIQVPCVGDNHSEVSEMNDEVTGEVLPVRRRAGTKSSSTSCSKFCSALASRWHISWGMTSFVAIEFATTSKVTTEPSKVFPGVRFRAHSSHAVGLKENTRSSTKSATPIVMAERNTASSAVTGSEPIGMSDFMKCSRHAR